MIKVVLVVIGFVISFLIGHDIGMKSGKKKMKLEYEKCDKEYVYIDNLGRLHETKTCIELFDKNMNVEFKNIDSIKNEDLLKICPQCVKDFEYEKLKNIADANKKDTSKTYRIDVSYIFNR